MALQKEGLSEHYTVCDGVSVFEVPHKDHTRYVERIYGYKAMCDKAEEVGQRNAYVTGRVGDSEYESAEYKED